MRSRWNDIQLPTGMVGTSVYAYFIQELQVMVRTLNHPNIARFLICMQFQVGFPALLFSLIAILTCFVAVLRVCFNGLSGTQAPSQDQEERTPWFPDFEQDPLSHPPSPTDVESNFRPTSVQSQFRFNYEKKGSHLKEKRGHREHFRKVRESLYQGLESFAHPHAW